MTYPTIGSVSEGTLRDEDLLNTFAGELSYHMKRMRLTRDQRRRFRETLKDAYAMSGDQDGHPGNMQCQSEIIDELQDTLNEIASPYTHFGASEGDGASFGFWPYIDDELPRLIAGDPIPRDHWGDDVLLVNDHGNVACGYVDKRGKFHEYWSYV